MEDALMVHQSAAPKHLLLLFHGVGGSPADLEALGAALAPQRPEAWIVSVRSPDPSDFGVGWQWFSVQGVDEANRPARVAATMPRFVETVRRWQREAGVGAAGTTLLGFSQGAIMALESTQQAEPPAARVFALAGRFAQPPRLAPAGGSVHLMHGEQDRVMPVALSADAARQLAALGATVTLDRFPGLGHGIDAAMLRRVIERLAAPA